MTAHPTQLVRVDKRFADYLRARAKRSESTVVAVTRSIAVAAMKRARRRKEESRAADATAPRVR